MSGPKSANGAWPATDEMACLKQAVNILKIVEDLGRTIEYENDVGADLADALAVVRALLTAVAARIVPGRSKEGEGDR